MAEHCYGNLKAIDLLAADILFIDLVALVENRFAIRYYDYDDRRVVVLEMDDSFSIGEEHRAHVAEWLEDIYHELGVKAISPYELICHLMDLYGIPERVVRKKED